MTRLFTFPLSAMRLETAGKPSEPCALRISSSRSMTIARHFSARRVFKLKPRHFISLVAANAPSADFQISFTSKSALVVIVDQLRYHVDRGA